MNTIASILNLNLLSFWDNFPCLSILIIVFVILWIWLFIEARFAPDWSHLGELTFPVFEDQERQEQSEKTICSECGRAL